jgi:Holliday junction DNA helicase RuvA
MIAYIEGTITEINPAYVVVENNGIGFHLNISLNTFSSIKEQKECKLYTHLTIRNEATTPVGFNLFGFADPAERQLFRQLITVSGVGNNTALLILSALPPEKLMTAIAENDVELLKTVKGIGLKSAQRIIIDLNDKIKKGKISADLMEGTHNTIREQALSGLTVLGFAKGSAEKALEKILKEQGADLSVEYLIKEALRIL